MSNWATGRGGELEANEPRIGHGDGHGRDAVGGQPGPLFESVGACILPERVVPGTSDCYAHDVDGRPVLRVTEPSHGHLTAFLRPIADTLRRALGSGTQIVLAFDRGGAYPATMAELRDAGVHFVTYERKPYAVLSSTMFEPDGIVRIGKEVYGGARTWRPAALAG
jgi:hypothetical protein